MGRNETPTCPSPHFSRLVWESARSIGFLTFVERFGRYLDTYKLQDAVDDGATVQILYEGKTADSAIQNKSQFDDRVEEHLASYVPSQLRKAQNVELLEHKAQRQNRPFDDLVREQTDDAIIALKRKWGTMGDLMEADKRIEAIAICEQITGLL